MTEPTSPLLGMPVLDVPHPHRVNSRAPSPRPVSPNDGPPKVALPSAKKTIVGGVDDLPPAPRTEAPATRQTVKVRPAVQKTILGTAPPTLASPAPIAASAPAQKTKLGTGFEEDALRPTLPEIAAPAPPSVTPTSSAPLAARSTATRVSVEPIEVPTTSTSVALWMLVIAIVALIAGVAYTF